MARLGVDVGGTFTDLVAIRDGAIEVTKTPSTPDAPERGVVNGVEDAAERGAIDPSGVEFLGHGTTVATNAVLEREWATTALVTTGGFRDALEIGRQDRPDLYDFGAEKPPPVVPRDRRFEVPERLDERGEVIDALDEAAVREIARDLPDDVESVAVSLLFAFEDDAHERRVAEIVGEERDVAVSRSSRVLPEIREYERTLATALNAALKPVMDRYVGALVGRLDDLGVPAAPAIMQSNGGLAGADAARERPVETLLSGPAAGVQGAAYVAGLAGIDDLVTMDMGGTSCDVSLVRDGEPITSTEVTVGDYPVSVPTVDVHTIGAGGGSIGWIDDGGALRVGPRSAGADPGPVCYGRGGSEPTVTDAHFLLGRIDPAAFGHGFDVDEDAVRAAVRERVADPLDMGVEEAAQGLLDVANATMERALRVVSVERGHDPRDLGLAAFGGAGPLHAPALAAELDVPRVLVPDAAGVLSALGLLVSDVVYRFSASMVRAWDDVDPATLAERFREFEAAGEDRLADEGIDPSNRQFERRLDVRYAGQSFDLSIPAPGDFDDGAMDDLAERFHAAHERRYGHASPDEPLELVTLRLRARGVVPDPDLRADASGGSVDDAIRGERPVVFEGEPHGTRIYDRDALPVDAAFDGPAVVEGSESTALIPPGQRARVDEYANLVVSVDG